MTLVGSVVETTRAKAQAVEAKAALYIPQILDAHKQVVAAERNGHRASLDLAIAAGNKLLAAKEEIKGKFKWTDWCSEYLSDIPQTTRSLYMRLANNKDRLLKPDLSTEEGKRISNGVATLSGKGELSIRKAAALLVTRTRSTPTKPKPKSGEDIGKAWLKGLVADELVTVLREVHGGTEYLQELAAALTKATEQVTERGSGLRRPLNSTT
jgi:hypothetical protein